MRHLALALILLAFTGCKLAGPRETFNDHLDLPDGRPDLEWCLLGTDGLGGRIMFVDVAGGRLFHNLRTGALTFAAGEFVSLQLSEHPGRE